jgi:hypothetical protein
MAKTYIQPDDDSDDEAIAMLIRWASSQVREFTDRLFTLLPDTPVPEQRAIYFRGIRALKLDDPLKNVTEIIAPANHFVDGELFPLVLELTTEDYQLEQRPTGTTLRLNSPGDGRFDVTGEWGWEEIPGTIEQAVIATADEWYRSNVLPTPGGREEGESESRNLYLPREVQEMLEPWILRTLVA